MKPTYLLGDHHGDYEGLFEKLQERQIRNATVIHVGDGEEGYPGWNMATAEAFNTRFAALGIEYLSIRGNHSNPHVFVGSTMLPNFKLLADYTRREINGQSWLFVGGAVSVNRIDRTAGKTWWPEEAFEFRPELARPADVLVTHSGPSWIGPSCRNPFVDSYCCAEAEFGRETLIQELRAERKAHENLFRAVKPRTWFFGHFHERAEKTRSGCRTRILDCHELVLHVSNL
ncbi:MAG: metallophosphoesterase [Luteolibacter sp.]